MVGVSKVSGLSRTPKVTAFRSGGEPKTPQRMPGQNSYEAITLERGVTHDVEFEQWANKVWDYHNSSRGDQAGGSAKPGDSEKVSLKDFRKDMVIELYNEAGQIVRAYNVYRCWPSEFTVMPELDANSNAVAIQSIKLENEGWELDAGVK